MTSFMLGKSPRSFPSSVSCLPVCLPLCLLLFLQPACLLLSFHSPCLCTSISILLIIFLILVVSFNSSNSTCSFPTLSSPSLFSSCQVFFSLSPLCDYTFPPFPQDCVPPLHSRACLSDRRSLSILPWSLMTSSSLPSCSCCHCTWESEQDKWALRPLCAKVRE